MNRPSPVDGEIERTLDDMSRYLPESSEYHNLIANLERLMKLKAENRKGGVSPDTLAIVAGNLLGILLIVAYEQKHVMSSRGFGQIIKPKYLDQTH
jgi:hypothetical protein